MKMAIYCRVSTREQTTDNQAIILKDHAKRKGWNFDIFTETESTRKTRPIKARLLNLLRNKVYDGVCILRLDRWARSSQELILEIEELYNNGVEFISLHDNIDLSTATGKLQFQILSAFAEFERNLIQDRTLDGLSRARKAGKTLGRPKGSKDKKIRRKSGYWLRYAKSKESPPVKTDDSYIKDPPGKQSSDYLIP